MLIRAKDSFLLVVDVQQKLAPAIEASAAAIANIITLVRSAIRLDVPVLACEHYAAGLGHVVPAVAAWLPNGSVAGKIYFSCLSEPGWTERIASLGRRQAILCGMETHVCLLQSAIELQGAGYHTFVVGDASSTRRAINRRLALARMRAEGITIVRPL
jgi:nicotinamidase-related amidase